MREDRETRKGTSTLLDWSDNSATGDNEGTTTPLVRDDDNQGSPMPEISTTLSREERRLEMRMQGVVD